MAIKDEDPDDKFAKSYEQRLWNVRLVALIGNALYSLNRFLCFCALTWSMTVILGAVLTSISKDDYYYVAFLLLLEAVRASVARLFRQIVLQQVFYGSTDPRLIVYDDQKKQKRLFWIRAIEQSFQVVLVGMSFIGSSARVIELEQNPSNASRTGVAAPEASAVFRDVVGVSLRVFYYLVLFNAFLFGLLIFKPLVLLMELKRWTQQQQSEEWTEQSKWWKQLSMSLMKYHDHIQWIGTEHGFVQSCADVDFFSFAFRLQAEEYRSNQRAPVVMNQYSDMFRYLYCHPRFKGFEKARQVLASGDPFEREAAANIVGCWARMMKKTDSGKLKTLTMQSRLLEELLNAAEHTETGRAAASSLLALSEMDATRVARVRNGKGQPIADVLMEAIHETVVVDKPDKALVYIKVWIYLLLELFRGNDGQEMTDLLTWYNESSDNTNVESDNSSQVSNCLFTKSKFRVMQRDLIRIVMNQKSLKRTQTVAAYALLSSENQDPALSERRNGKCIMELLRERVAKVPDIQRNHVLKEHMLPEEKDWLFILTDKTVTQLEWGDNKIGVREVPSKPSEGGVFLPLVGVAAPAIVLLVVVAAAAIIHLVP